MPCFDPAPILGPSDRDLTAGLAVAILFLAPVGLVFLLRQIQGKPPAPTNGKAPAHTSKTGVHGRISPATCLAKIATPPPPMPPEPTPSAEPRPLRVWQTKYSSTEMMCLLLYPDEVVLELQSLGVHRDRWTHAQALAGEEDREIGTGFVAEVISELKAEILLRRQNS